MTPRYKLRTLLILLVVLPPLLAGAWFAAHWLGKDGNLLYSVLVFLGVTAYRGLAVLAANAKRLIRLAAAGAAKRIRRAD